MKDAIKQLFDRANAEQAAGRPQEAEATCRELLALDKGHFGAWHLLGIVALRSGDPQRALAHVEHAVALAPARADCRNSLGFVLRALGRNDDAEIAFREAVDRDPDFVEAHYQLGNQLRESGRAAEAEASYRRGLTLTPDHYQAHNNLGAALAKQRRFEEAVMEFRRAIALRPDYAEAHVNLGHALRAAGYPEDAEAACRCALALAPRHSATHLNLGLALQDLGQNDDALASFQRATALDPDNQKAVAAEGILHLLRGDLATGWDKYEARWSIGDLPARDFRQPQWHGEPLRGKTILLHAEQGFGDTIQFLRYVPQVVALGGNVVVEVQPALKPLADRLAGVEVIARGVAPPAFDLHCPLLSLPLAFHTTLDGIPAVTPYLSPAPDRLVHWQTRTGRNPGLKIGIAWAGSPVHRNDRNRSIPIERLAPLFGRAGLQFFSLQVGPRALDLAAVERAAIVDLSAELTDFGETAAAIANLDLVIATDTAVVHLAGALGKPVWTMLPFATDWRWLVGRSDSPWYPSMRLFRQPRINDWGAVVDDVCRALAERLMPSALPDDARRAEYIALVHAANEHHLARRHAECEVALRRVLDMDPSNSSAWHVLALTRHALGDKAEAIEVLQKAIALQPNSHTYLNDLSIMLHSAQRFPEALDASDRAVALNPDNPATYNGRGATLSELGRSAEAKAAYLRALALKPNYYEACTNLAHSQQALLELEDAAESYRRALGMRHDYPEAQCSAAMLALLRGDYANGFTQFEWRWRLKVMTPRDFTQPVWQGERLDGKTILLHAEQGLGDTLQCLRFVPEVAARGGRVVLELPSPLTRLATSLEGGGEIVVQGSALPHFDVHCAFMSLPRVLGVTLDNLAGRLAPYLRAAPDAIERWARRLAGTGTGLKVGLAWAGNPAHAGDRRRSIPVERLAALVATSGVSFFSLQVGDRAQDLALLPPGRVVDLAAELTSFAETAAAVANLDLVITVDSAVAHLAGAIGRPCWIVLPFCPDWRWLTERSDSPWYPTVRLFRQPRPGEWDEILGRVGTELASRVREATPQGPPLDARKLLAEALKLRDAGRAGEAEALARRILASDPGHRPTLYLLGVLCEAAGDLIAAADFFARLVELAPDDAEAHFNLATVLAGLDRHTEATDRYRRAIALNPAHARAFSNLGGALHQTGRLEEAEAACREALALDPKSAAASVNLGLALASQSRIDEAVDTFRRACELNPHLPEARLNLGLALHNLGRLEEALTCYRQAVVLRPDYAQARMAEAFALLTMGRDFPNAFSKLEWRWRLASSKPRGFTQPLWGGEAIAGKTILLHAEQGFGDSLMLLRYVPMVAARGARVIVELPKSLTRLAAQIASPNVTIVADGAQLPLFDVHCPLMSLPLAFGTTLKTIPTAVPYLYVEREAAERWKTRLKDAPGLKAGVVWAGSALHLNDRTRSIGLDRITALFGIPDVSWFSLQVGERAGDLLTLAPGQISDLSTELADFAETAAAVANLDLVITVDTAIAHLAGALGKPVWILLAFNPDWRWLTGRTDSPWYPTARLFRQPSPGDWASAIASLRSALHERLAGEQPTRVPVTAPRVHDRRYVAAVELMEAGRDTDAEAALKVILDGDPGDAPALRRMAWLHYKRGDNVIAAGMLSRSLEREPENPDSHFNLGLILAALGHNKRAEASYRRGIELKPNSVDGYNDLAVLLEAVGRYTEAEESYRRAIELNPAVPHLHNNLGVLLKESGRLGESLAVHRRVVALDSRLPAGRSNLLYTLNYDETLSAAEIFAEHSAWGRDEVAGVPGAGARFTNSPEPGRRLRVGYVSGDFRHHSVAFFFAPLLAAHDRGQVEVFLYTNDVRADPMTAELKSRADHWVEIYDLSDELAAARIREDAIDILVDLSGHTARNRMMLFARKPAPIQVTWLGYPNTTGLPAIDYRLTDAVADPPGTADSLHSEKLVRIEPSFLCYRPPQDAGPVAPLPALRYGHVTFGSFNNFAKLSPATIALWTQLLREVPGSRLLLKAPQFKDGATRERCIGAFVAAGLAPERLEVMPPLSAIADHLAHYARVDIALDPLPYNGTATSCEALWMGVPVVTLRGNRHAARVGASIMSAIDLEELIVANPEEYVAIAARVARDLGGLAALRAGLRDRLSQSPLCDSVRFARAIEDAFRTMWRDWCTAQHLPAESLQPGPKETADPAALDAAEAQAKRLFDANALDEAEAVLRGLIDRAPQRAIPWFLLGRVRHARKDNDAAIDFVRRALSVDPRLAAGHNDLGILLQGQGRLEEAEACYRRAIDVNGQLAEAMSNLGAVLAARGRLEEATGWYGQAIAGDAQFAPAHNNLGAALAKLDRADEAEAHHRHAIALKPDFADAHYNLGVSLQDQGRYVEALASYEKAIAFKPDHIDAHWNRAYLLLLLGRYVEGWREHEWRWRRREQPPRSYPVPLWRGEPLDGRTILLHAEQGMGDTLQFIRYVTLVGARGGQVVLQVPAPIVAIARASLDDRTRVLSDTEVLPEFDMHCPLLSLPLAFDTTLDTVPAEVPYLAVDPAAAKHWRNRVGDGPELKVGLVWAGNAQHKNDRNRSIALDRLAPIFGAVGIRWFSLQLGERKGELAQTAPDTLTDLSDGLTDFAQSAAAIEALDLIITVDTAAAHLAGGLAKPVWVLLPFVPDWRWLTEREDSPYYPTARLFRQPARGDWESVALCVRRALDQRTGAAAEPTPAEVERLVAIASTKLAAKDPGAEDALNALLAADPTRARAWHSLGVIAQNRGEQAKAVGFLRRAIALEPNAVDTQNNLGVALGALGRREEAMACYRRALELRPDYARANLNLGAVLMDVGAFAEAEDTLQRAATLDPQLAEAPYNLGNLHSKQGKDLAAIKCFNRATKLRPGFYEAHNNLGAALLKADNSSAAYRSFLRAVRLRPDEAEAHYNVAAALIQLGRYDRALASCRRTLAIDPQHAQANFSEAQILLARGDLREGFDKYEWRWRLGTLPPRGFSVPQWNGEALAGRTILLHGEQGYGDTIQGLRYVPLVAAQGGEVALEVPQSLRRLAVCLPGVARLVEYGEPLPRFDVFCPLLSLPRAFGTTLKSVPADIPYLAAEPEAAERWRARLSGEAGLKVGIVWAGSFLHRRDAQRSISIETLSALLGLDGVRWFSLQVGERVADLARLPAGRVTDLSPQLSDFSQTAAVIVNLDLVITVDTAIAHLAGALGRKAWVMLPYVSDWRWMLDREDSPWYPTLRLFRQSQLGDWDRVVARVYSELSALLSPTVGY